MAAVDDPNKEYNYDSLSSRVDGISTNNQKPDSEPEKGKIDSKPRILGKRKLCPIPVTQDLLQRFNSDMDMDMDMDKDKSLQSDRWETGAGRALKPTLISSKSRSAHSHSLSLETGTTSPVNLSSLSDPSLNKKQCKGVSDTLLILSKNRYNGFNSGPFLVQLEGIPLPSGASSPSPEQFGVIGIGKRISRIPDCKPLINVAYNFKRVGINKFNIYFPNHNNANTFVQVIWNNKDSISPKHMWIASIPNFKVYKQVILKGIDDIEIDTDSIFDNIRAPRRHLGPWRKPISITRLTKKIIDRDNPSIHKIINTHTIVAKFDYNNVTPTANIYGKTVYLLPFIQRVKRCAHCQRFGHIKQICRSSNSPPICDSCSQSGHISGDCPEPKPLCINCKRFKSKDVNHKASDPNCPAFIKQKNIKKIMAEHCLSPSEAIEFMESEELEDPRSNSHISSYSLYNPNRSSIPHPLFSDFLKNSNKNQKKKFINNIPPRKPNIDNNFNLDNPEDFPPLGAGKCSDNDTDIDFISKITSLPFAGNSVVGSSIRKNFSVADPHDGNRECSLSTPRTRERRKFKFKDSPSPISVQKASSEDKTCYLSKLPNVQNSQTKCYSVFPSNYQFQRKTTSPSPSPSPSLLTPETDGSPNRNTLDRQSSLFEDLKNLVLSNGDLLNSYVKEKHFTNESNSMQNETSEKLEKGFSDMINGFINIVFKSIIV